MQVQAIDGTTKLTGLIGWPVAHSLSPRLHQYWASIHGLNAAYVPLPVDPSRVGDALRGLRALHFVGANVTVPHKENVLEYVDELAPEAEAIGAVNTLHFVNGTLHGSNTDGYGFIQNLQYHVPNLAPHLADIVILGAGGSTRAMVYALLHAGAARITLCNRTLPNAEALASYFDSRVQVAPWEAREALLAQATALVNSTTLGMQGKEALTLSLAALAPEALVCDIVYAPLETPLLKAARARGNRAVGGLGMLLFQAQQSFARWHGITPAVDAALFDYMQKPLARSSA